MRPLLTNEIKSAFIPDDRKLWTEPCLENQPWEDLDFLAWRHKIPGYFYLVVPSQDELVGMVATNNQRSCLRSQMLAHCLHLVKEHREEHLEEVPAQGDSYPHCRQ